MKRTIFIAGLILAIAVLAVPSQPQPAGNAVVAVAFTGLESTLLTALGQTGRTLDAAVYDLTLDSVFTTLQALNAKGVTARILLSTEGGGGRRSASSVKSSMPWTKSRCGAAPICTTNSLFWIGPSPSLGL